MPISIDILENKLLQNEPELLELLLTDHITVEAITGPHGNIIRPRAMKSREEQQHLRRANSLSAAKSGAMEEFLDKVFKD